MDSLKYSFTVLYIVFIIKHFVGDFLLQTTWMATGKERAAGWIPPLATHVAVHAALTGMIAIAVAPGLWWLAIVDFLIHAAIDRSKSLVTMRLRVEPFTDARWWQIFGIDQSLHQLTHLGYVVVLTSV